jgi:hypothetical protein
MRMTLGVATYLREFGATEIMRRLWGYTPETVNLLGQLPITYPSMEFCSSCDWCVDYRLIAWGLYDYAVDTGPFIICIDCAVERHKTNLRVFKRTELKRDEAIKERNSAWAKDGRR